MADWSRITNTTIRKYIREEEINLLRNRKFLKWLKSKGRITFNYSGDDFDWKVQYKQAPLLGYADTDVLTFSRRDRWKTAVLGMRGYAMTDSETKSEMLKNKGTEAIVKIFTGLVERLKRDIENLFGQECYVDGNATGNTKRFHGVESFMGNGGAYSGGFIGSPSDTYAGLLTDLGNYGGSWSATTWPIGTGDSHYDFWSPLIVDYTDTLWTAATKTWPNTCVECMRFGIIHSMKNSAVSGTVDMIALDSELYRQFLANQETKERIVIDRGSSSGDEQTVGFGTTTYFDNVEVTFEYGIPPSGHASYTGVGYGFNFDEIDLFSYQDQLFVVEGPDYDIATQSHRVSLDCFGNFRFNPRYQLKFMAIT